MILDVVGIFVCLAVYHWLCGVMNWPFLFTVQVTVNQTFNGVRTAEADEVEEGAQ